LFLALVPFGLAVVLFALPRTSRGGGAWWWLGAVTFIAFLPNAPYVGTDLVHLRGTLASQAHGERSTLVVLGAYAVLMVGGGLAYLGCVLLLRRWLLARGFGHWAAMIELAVHALCTIGVVLGRVFRFNSWDLVIRPQAVVDAVGVPKPAHAVAIVVLFGLLCATSVVTRLLPARVREPNRP
ncbi:MAG: hypothetical protein QOE63_1696, partial [Acidimicrobiaceae bacterium]